LTIHPSITEFIAELEQLGSRRLTYPIELGELLQLAIQTGRTQEFEELIFQAKFLTRTHEVMRKIGNQAEGFEKLSTEFEISQNKSVEILKKLVDRSAPELEQKYSGLFFSMDTTSFSRLLKLYADLQCIKNWQIDGRPLPFESTRPKPSGRTYPSPVIHEENRQQADTIVFRRLQRIAVLAVVLFVLFILIDPPVTILGWILSLGIMVMLAYIDIQLILITRKRNLHL
jgi:hypothetical protein